MIYLLLISVFWNTQAGEGDLGRLATWMTGVFSSEQQAAEDESYFHIRLVMMPIWETREDGHWFYVEQAAAGSFDKPYRQRVYHVRKGKGDVLESAVFTLADPSGAIAAWRSPEIFAALGPADLVPRDGCTVFLEAEGDRFVGGTHEADCPSSLRGASYATSEIEVLSDRLLSWDRGFDGEDKQVWGAEKGGYIFLKTGAIKNLLE